MVESAISPHPLFTVWSADEVAECLDGVSADLYRKLYEVVIPRVNTPGLDYREIPDDFSDRCLAKSWGRLASDDQALLNQLAAKSESEAC